MSVTTLSTAIDALTRAWWLVLLRGLVAIALGVTSFVWPDITLVTLVWMFGLYAVIDGGSAIAVAIAGTSVRGRLWLGLAGVVSIVAGIGAFIWPGMTGYILVIMIGVWSVLRGALEIAAAIELRKMIENEWLLVLSGIASILFGLVIFFFPASGALAVVWLLALWACVFGVLLVALAFRLRSLRR